MRVDLHGRSAALAPRASRIYKPQLIARRPPPTTMPACPSEFVIAGLDADERIW